MRLLTAPIPPALWPVVYRRAETRVDVPTALGEDGTAGVWQRVITSAVETYGEPQARTLAPVLTDSTHRACPMCGAQLTLQRKRMASYWHHAPTPEPCDYVGWTISPRVYVPPSDGANAPVQPRSKADGRYRWALDHQKDYEGHDNRADYAREQFKRRAQRTTAGVLQGSLDALFGDKT